MVLPVVRTRDEAHLYLDLRPCDCGSVETDWESGVVAVDSMLATAYSGTCSACGTEREFVFALPEREVLPEGFPAFGGPEPDSTPPCRRFGPLIACVLGKNVAPSGIVTVSAPQR